MKVKPEIKEKIIAAANALAAEGIESPTNDQVRERMGSGSLSHISPVMREWRESRKAEVVAALEMPADLKKAIESSVGQVWTAASKLASATIDTVRQEADAAIETATGERDEALTEITRLENQIAELEKALAAKEQEVNQAKTELEQERGQNTKLTTENAALVARVDDRDEQIKGLKTELKEARDDNKALQGELIEIARKTKE
ncbi:MAG: DNA-binding protein [Gammaproteobacteria bacterium]|nr:DNA-binding protein [Gammaproteobacteria bacterium]